MDKLVLKIIQKYFLNIDSNIRAGDLVKHIHGDATYEALGFRYDINLKPSLFIRDVYDNYIYEISKTDMTSYERISNIAEIANANH